ncbi:MAG: response regulator [Ktedonobacteraceae bacterium]|nr:response regulator [Ktedonobacteraceae bacterium]
MSDIWRIFVVEGDEALNHNIVNSLRKDGYIVQSVVNGADAVHILWSEEYDVVICDLNASGADGFELLSWLRASHPNTRTILIGAGDADALRLQALESGAAGYLEKPLDMHLLKEELRRLLQQTGFSANLDSFDLLDVIQIITMSRKSIALLVNTGLEERGLLCFKGGDLIWAEYGILRGEEAFFALAAHKNGTVTQQSWNEQVTANVTQPLSRLIFQALQYRTKYANQQPYSGEQAPVSGRLQFNEEPILANNLLMAGEEDDTPFGVLGDSFALDAPAASLEVQRETGISEVGAPGEWWESAGAALPLKREDGIGVASASLASNIEVAPTMSIDGHALTGSAVTPPIGAYQASSSERNDLPSWLTDQPTAANMQAIPSPSPSVSSQIPVIKTASPEWQPPQPGNRTRTLASGESAGMKPVTEPPKQATGNHQRRQATGTQNQMSSQQNRLASDTGGRRVNSAEWQMPELAAARYMPLEGDVEMPALGGTDKRAALSEANEENGTKTATSQAARRNYNYSALVSALQTLGYSIPGFIAAAVVTMDGEPIAQVAVDDLNISRVCKHFSNVLKGTLQTLNQGMWGDYQDTVITSSDRYILMRIIDSERSTFQVLITTREAKSAESLEVMANVESAISAALQSS